MTYGDVAEAGLREHMNPGASIPLSVLPNRASRTMTDDTCLYLLSRRLRLRHRCLSAVPDQCSCARRAPLGGDGRHLESCKVGAGPTHVHNAVRDTLRACAANAGFNSRTEEPGLIDNSDQRPADVYIEAWGPGGADLSVDVAVVSTRSDDGQSTSGPRRRQVGKAARDKERAKMLGRVTDSDERIETHLRRKGITFQAMVFETTGASTSTWGNMLKALSESAHERRGHDAETFRNHWKVEMAMTIAKRSAKAAVRRAWNLAGRRGARLGDSGEDVLGEPGVEAPALVGEDGGGDGGIALRKLAAAAGGG